MRKRKGAVILALAMMLLLVPVMAQAGTWRQNYIGWWWQEADGSWPSNEWKSINGNWYLFDADGYIRYGWYWDGTNWYYLGGKSDGAMKTGWQVVNGNWYYMYKDGRMAANTWIGSCYVNSSGVWIQNAVKSQWIQSGNRWWYRHPDGSYTANNWETINNKKYHFDKNGWMQTGWQKIDGIWYYLGPAGSGAMRSSQWVEECYLGADGKMLTSCWVDDYYVGVSGKIAKDQWVGDSYVGADGKKVSSQWVGDYYVGEDGTYVKNQWVGDYYVGPDGKYEKNQWVGDYYVGENGKKVRNTWIDNRYLDADGKWDRTKPVPVPLEGIKVSTTGTLLKPGKTSGIDLYFFPENTTDDRTATWKSSDESVATVEDGIVTGHKAGYATITVTVGEKSEKIEYLVVPTNPSELTMKIAYYTSDASCVKFGESAQVSVFLQPGNFDITSYATISVDDENILKTNNGVGMLWSVGIGETTVRAAYEDLEVSSPVKVVSEDGNLQELSFDKKILYLEKNQTGSIRLKNTTEKEREVFFRAETQEQSVLLEKMELKVELLEKEENRILYQGSAAACTPKELQSLGKLAPQEEKQLRFTFSLAKDADNTYALQKGKIKFWFTTGEEETGKIATAVSTGDPQKPIGYLVTAVGAAIVLLFMLLGRKRPVRK